MATMRKWAPLLAVAASLKTSSGLQVELKEIVNPGLARVGVFGAESDCSPSGCLGVLTRDGDLSDGSRYSCSQPGADSNDDECSLIYQLYEDSRNVDAVTLASVYVAFAASSKTTLRVLLDSVVVVESWTGEEGSAELQEIPGLGGYAVERLTVEPILEEGEWFGITETEIYIEVDEVPIVGISATDLGDVTATATVNNDSAMKTRDGNTSKKRAWSCVTGDVCEITYDLGSVQSMEQIRIAFVEKSSTEGATANVYTAGADSIFRSALTGVFAGSRDPSIVEDLQTFGGVRALARYVKVEGIVGTGGKFSISEVEIRLKEDRPSYPTALNSKWVPTGPLPLGSSPFGGGVDYLDRSESEGGCSAGRLEGCSIFNIKDGDSSVNSRWSCGPQLGTGSSNPCAVSFVLNNNRYLRQIQLAFYNGDEEHTEFSVLVKQEEGWATAIPSAISSGDTTDFQTWDLKAYTNEIQILPKFGNVKDWMAVTEMVLLEKKQSSSSTPVQTYSNSAKRFDSSYEVPLSELRTTFSFDLDNVGDTGVINLSASGGGQTAAVSAIKMKFRQDETFVFDVTWRNEDNDDVSERFTSAGGARMWEGFVLSEAVDLRRLSIVAVEGPAYADDPEYPALRVRDCKIIASLNDAGKVWVVSTMMTSWGMVPDYIGDGTSDQEELMQAICGGIGEGFDGVDCDGVISSESPLTTEVNMVASTYYIDGPVFLKSGVNLAGQFFLDDGLSTEFRMYGSGSGAGVDGIINADGVAGVEVSEIVLRSNVEPGEGVSGTFGSVCLDVQDSEDVVFDEVSLVDCPTATASFVRSDRITFDYCYGSGAVDGNMLVLQGVTDYYLTRTSVSGMLIDDSTNVVLEVGQDDEFGDPLGDIRPPKGGEQSANLVITATSSGVVLKGIDVFAGAEPRIILESTSPLTLDAVTFLDVTAGECLVQVPQGSDETIIVQLNTDAPLELSDNGCFVLA